ncbi:MAG: OmpA family protein [Candidatus Firestonebacteria bacterium]|nr:OmpA family protein [Candidatus Firestonebacteria bacterium]
MHKKRWAAFLVLSLALSGCASLNNAAIYGGTGAALGAGVGAIIGNQFGNHSVIGALVGAAVGGTAGALIGANMDKQAAELKNDLKGAKVERVGEGIKITFDSGILIASGSAVVQSEAVGNINRLSATLNKYKDTNILVEGHTDSTGKEETNQALSERRATAVGNLLKSGNVLATRISTMGYGATQPVADNATPDGRQQNRRVEIAIFANEKMKKAAQNGKL